MTKTLTTEQAMRYNRQIVLPQIDLEGQEALLNASVLVIGVGGLGCNAAQSLAAMGVGRLTLVDDDTVSVTNLPRQILFCEEDAGSSKVLAAKRALHRINSDCLITTVDYRPALTELSEVIQQHDIVLDCTDNKSSRQQINQLCAEHGTPLVSGAAIRFEGQVFVTTFAADMPCYNCLAALFGEIDLSCTEAGIFSPVVAITGLQQALLTSQLLTGFGETPVGKLQLFDALTHTWQHFSVPRLPGCQTCHHHNTAKERL
ncbi:HesA/MoeB/ThiF family protein [Salinimonas lutimaris]|uniref:HesA/MoeB/ThiF family protein n=1 Tax=Salinimonas lutimaris TaxID=914153 RepID=UPI0010BFDBCA|nr:molybdopterin-synthase adenylyltransferase MoeB [Salinimonas lutimaris]